MMRTVAEGRHASRMRIAAERLQRSKPRIEANCCIGVLRHVSLSERHDVHRRRVLPRIYATTNRALPWLVVSAHITLTMCITHNPNMCTTYNPNYVHL